MNTKTKGNLGELRVAADLIDKGFQVAFPFGDDWKCDLLVYKNDKLLKIQVKYAESSKEYLLVRCSSTTKRKNGETFNTPYLSSDVDWVAVFDRRTDQCYYIPIKECDSTHTITLRFVAPKNKQISGIRWAKDYASIA